VEKLRRSPALLAWLIARAVRVKVSLVSKDERETLGIRTLLNFGHTFGHALEAATHYSRTFTHGEAVAIGMRVAAELSRRLHLIAPRDAKRITCLLQKLGLPTVLRGVPLGGIERAMAHDKKWAQGRQRWVLPTRIGKALVRSGIPGPSVRAAIVSVMEG
jgi:3-dehydroquinate synthetase